MQNSAKSMISTINKIVPLTKAIIGRGESDVSIKKV